VETIAEQVAFLEGRVGEHGQMIAGVREALVSLEGRVDARLLTFEERMDRRFEQIDKRFDQMDRRFEQIDRRFEQIEQRFERIDLRFEHLDQRLDRRFGQTDVRFTQVDRRMDALDAKVSRQFVWLVGLHVTSLIAMMGALGGIITALLTR
jgi:flagellar capping protein FliD